MDEKQEAIDERAALVEMYKAGFLDAYRLSHKLNNKKDWIELNKSYKECFCDRFEKKIKKVLKN